MPKLQRDTWSKFGNEVGAELNLLFSAVSSLGVAPSPNTRTKQTSTGTVLEFINRDGAKATTETTPEVTEQWFKLVAPETDKPTGYKLPEWYDAAGNQITPPTDSVTYGNRAGLKVYVWVNNWMGFEQPTFAARDYIQLDEVAGLGLPCDKDGNLISGREEEYTWIAPPPIPLNCINPITDDNGYNAQWINWLNDYKWGKPTYKHGDTLAECTRDNDAFYQHTNYSTGNISTHLYYPCYNELYGNGTIAEMSANGVGKKLMLMFGWDYWRSLWIDSYIGNVGSMNPEEPHRFRIQGRTQPTNIIKAVKLPSSVRFGSQNAATEIIECNWMDSNEAGRVWTAINNYFEGINDSRNLIWDAAFPDIEQYKQAPLLAQNNNGYYLHNRHRASNFIKHA